MQSFPAWMASHAKGTTKRLTYALGAEAKLRERIIATVREEEEAELVTVWAEDNDPEVWAELNTHPMRQSKTKLVVVRNAHKVKNWAPLDAWLSDMRTVRCVMESEQSEFSLPLTRNNCSRNHAGPVRSLTYKSGRVKKTCTVCDATEEILGKRGRMVLCDPPATDAARKATIQMLTDQCGSSRIKVEQLLQYTAWRVDPALEILEKLDLLGAPLQLDLVQLLGVPMEDTRYERHLRNGERAKAVTVAHLIGPDEIPRVLERCENWLSQIARVSRCVKAGQTTGEIANAVGIEWGLAIRLTEQASRFDVKSVNRATMALANAERDWFKGARTGVLEVLAASW